MSARNIAFALSALALTISSTRAVLLPVGGTVTLTGSTAAARPELDCVDVVNQTIPFSFTNTATGGTVSGTLFDDVAREDVSGTLDFYYAVTLNARSSPAGSIRSSGFDGYSTDVDFRIDGSGTVDPNSANRFTGTESGDIDFIFSTTPINAGQTTQMIFIKTTATTYNLSGLTDITADAGLGVTGLSTLLATYAPGSVPEPGMMGVGVLSLAVLRRRRRLPS